HCRRHTCSRAPSEASQGSRSPPKTLGASVDWAYMPRPPGARTLGSTNRRGSVGSHLTALEKLIGRSSARCWHYPSSIGRNLVASLQKEWHALSHGSHGGRT